MLKILAQTLAITTVFTSLFAGCAGPIDESARSLGDPKITISRPASVRELRAVETRESRETASERIQAARARALVHRDEAPAARPTPPSYQPINLQPVDYDAIHYRVAIRFPGESILEGGHPSFSGQVELTFRPVSKLSILNLDSLGLDVKTVRLLNTWQPLHFEADDTTGTLAIDLGAEYAATDTLTIAIDYTWDNRLGEGMYFRSRDGVRGTETIFSQSEPELSKYWFPGNSRPNDRATFEALITVPDPFVAVSNGSLLKTVAGPAAGERTYHWAQQTPMVSYLFVVTAGKFGVKRAADWNQIPVEYYGPADDLERLEYSLRKTPEMLTQLSKLTGLRYPYEKYAQVVVPQYQWGGMEHTTATTLTDRTVHSPAEEPEVDSEALTSHELAHQWFGDLVTCKSWDHLWLNEGFATYFEMAWAEHSKGRERFLEELSGFSEWYFWEATNEGGRFERPIVFPYQVYTADDFFDSHAYAKGGWVLHMLRELLGDETFHAGIRKYVYNKRDSLAVTDDLQAAMESASGRDLDWFFDQWVYKPGFPKFDVSWQQASDTGIVTLTVKQTQDTAAPGGVAGLTPLFRGPIRVEAGGKTHELALAGMPEERFQLMPTQPGRLSSYVHFNSGMGWLAQTRNHQPLEAWETMLNQSADLTARVQAAQEIADFAIDESAGADAWARLRARKLRSLESCGRTEAKSWVRVTCLDGLRGVLRAAYKQVQAASPESAASPDLQELQAAIAQTASTVLSLARSEADLRVRGSAIAALGTLPADRALPALRERIQNEPSFGNLRRSIETLGTVSAPEAYDLVMSQLGRESFQDSARTGVLTALSRIQDLRSLAVAEEYAQARYREPLRISAFELLASLGKKFPAEAGDRALGTLTAPLQASAPAPFRIKRGLIRALGILGNPTVLPLLRDIAEHDADGRIREEAVTAIHEIEAAGSANGGPNP